MSDNGKKSNIGIRDSLLQGLYASGVYIFVLVVLMILTSLVMLRLSQPELVYGWIGYALISLASFLVGKLFIKVKFNTFYPWMFFVIFTALLYFLLSLFMGNGKIELIQFLLKLLSFFAFSFLGAIGTKKVKKTKKRSKRQSHR